MTLIMDTQRVTAALIFDGPLEGSKKRIGGDRAPGGTYETDCRVPRFKRMCGVVSRLWQEKFREWRDKEIDKRFRIMCRAVLYRATDMCDRARYSKRADVPPLSTLEDAFFVNGVKVVSFVFQRSGKKDVHVLSTHLSVLSIHHAVGLSHNERTVETPRHGWKSIRDTLDGELEQWRAWADAEWEAQHAWIWSCL